MLIRTTLLILLIFLAMNADGLSQTIVPVENGVSQTMARWRAANYSEVRYKLNITLERGAPLMKGELEIRVTLSDEGAKNDLVMDWRKTQFANDKDKPYAWVMDVNGTKEPPIVELNEHLKVPRTFLKSGENIIKIEFGSPIKTSGAAITRYVDKEDGGEYIYSLFVPSDASTAFPCFDQPDLKARFSLTLDVPKGWDVVSNTTPGLGSEGSRRSFYGENYKGVGFIFPETKPISTYVFAFAAGDFMQFTENDPAKAVQEISKNRNGQIPLEELNQKIGTRIFVRRSQSEKFKQHSEEVFRLNREGVKFLASYFDYPYPFPKYDLVLIPEFPFGGMEHAGATFLREDSIIFPQEPTANNYISRANVIFHETAHQWFGDTVTMRWFDDLWLKEGFAEFMAYKTLEKVMPQYNAWKTFYERNKQAAYLTDSTKGTTPIYQEISNLSAAKSAYGNIVYRKAPSFLRQAEFYLGPDKFQTAVRAFLKKHGFANAGWEDLVKEFEKIRGEGLGEWAEIWVKRPGLFKIGVASVPVTGSTKYKYYAHERHESLRTDNRDSIMAFKILVIYKDGSREEKYLGTQPGRVSQTFPAALKSEPKAIIPNYQDYGYGIFLMDDKSRTYVLQNIQNEKDDFLRAMMWGSLWDSVREGELDPKDYVELVVKNLASNSSTITTPSGEARATPPSKGEEFKSAGENDETTISVLLGRVSTAMNYYLSERQRTELVPRVEDILIEKILNTSSMGQKLTYYRSFLGIASTEKARAVLKDILKGQFTKRGPGQSNANTMTSDKAPVATDDKLPDTHVVTDQIPLKTKDKFDIVTRLLILGDKDAPALLAELEKTENSDEAKRYVYAAKAGIATSENKARYFSDFINNKAISESWIEAAFGPFNSVRHSELTIPYLEKALAELPNLKRNRKIFFINGWLGAFIGGQRSAEALAAINKFLADNPNLDKDLRLKILENADGLERAVKIRATFNN